MTTYSLKVKAQEWHRLDWETLRGKMRALIDAGAVLFETNVAIEFPAPPKPPEPVVRIEHVEVFVCPWVKCHKKFHTRSAVIRHYARVHKVTPVQIEK